MSGVLLVVALASGCLSCLGALLQTLGAVGGGWRNDLADLGEILGWPMFGVCLLASLALLLVAA